MGNKEIYVLGGRVEILGLLGLLVALCVAPANVFSCTKESETVAKALSTLKTAQQVVAKAKVPAQLQVASGVQKLADAMKAEEAAQKALQAAVEAWDEMQVKPEPKGEAKP
jgi:hypothetical protein